MQTRRWRERDSNYRSLGHGYLELARPALGCDFFRGNTHFSGATSCSTCQRSPAARPLTHLRPGTPWIGTTFRVHGMFYRNSTAWSSDFGTTGRRVSWYSVPQGGGKFRTCSEFEMTEHRAIAINKCRPWSSVFAARTAFDSSKKPCRTALLGGQFEQHQIPTTAAV